MLPDREQDSHRGSNGRRPSTPASRGSTPPARLIACSEGRSLIARWNPKDGGYEIVKVYEVGTLEEARSEAGIGERLSDLQGLIPARRAEIDAQRGRPCVVMDYHPGTNLEAWIAGHGAAPPRAAAAVGRAIARTLSALHATGLIHRDIKPANIYLADEGTPHPARSEALLIDFEHTIATGSEPAPTRARFTGGTHGYAPPEAYRGAAADEGFDAFGFGAALHALLTGRRALRIAPASQPTEPPPRTPLRRTLLGIPEPLAALVRRCLGPSSDRPRLAEVDVELSRYLATEPDPSEAALDRALTALLRGDLPLAREQLAANPSDSPRHDQLQRRLERAERLLKRVPPLPTNFDWPAIEEGLVPTSGDTGRKGLEWCDGALALAQTITAQAPRLAAFLDRFPNHGEALTLRGRLRREHDALLRTVPRRIPALKRAGHFEVALELLQATMAAVAAAECLPDSTPRTESSHSGAVPGALLRDPHRYLRAALETIESDARVHRELLLRLERAEAKLDLAETQRILDSATEHYSGANEIVAGLKDRQHRLRFYLKRLACPQSSIEELANQLQLAQIDHSLAPIDALQTRCRQFLSDAPVKRIDGSIGLRGLRRLLQDVADEFPHLAPVVADAAETLDRARAELTDRSWLILDEAHTRLGATPVPIRPLQRLVNQLDALRLAEVFVDRPERRRAELLDELERVRLQVDQARTTRDSITHGARAAIDRGHLTTAVYEMERAVERFASDESVGSREEGTAELMRQLEEAQRRKRALDEAAARNMALAAQLQSMERDPTATTESRLALLVERQDRLRFLVDNVHEERSELYRGDLREVDIAILRAQSDRAAAELTRQASLPDRLRAAQATLGSLEQLVREHTEPDPAASEPVLQHWRSVLTALRAEEAEQLAHREAEERSLLRRRRWRTGATVALLTVIGLAGWFARAALAGTDAVADLRARMQSAADHDQLIAALEVRPTTEDLEGLQSLGVTGRELIDALRGFRPTDAIAWGERMGERLQRFHTAIGELEATLGEHADAAAILLRLERFRNSVAAETFRRAEPHIDSESDRSRLRERLSR